MEAVSQEEGLRNWQQDQDPSDNEDAKEGFDRWSDDESDFDEVADTLPDIDIEEEAENNDKVLVVSKGYNPKGS